MGRISTKKQQINLGVETLEARLVPDAASYVNGLYLQVLHRSPTAAEVTAGVQLDQTSSATQLVASIWLSPEHRGLQVDSYYQSFLDRTETPAERQHWVNRFTNGGLSEVQVQTALLTSPEYLADHPGPTKFVQSLYQNLLGRAPSYAELSGWTAQLQTPKSYATVALDILTTKENETLVVGNDYVSLLNRTADAPGLTGFVRGLQDQDPGDIIGFHSLAYTTAHDTDNSQYPLNVQQFVGTIPTVDSSLEKVAVLILTSPEFFGDWPTVGTNPTTVTVTDSTLQAQITGRRRRGTARRPRRSR